MIASQGNQPQAGLRSKLAALVIAPPSGTRDLEAAPRNPKVEVEVSAAKRTQYYCPFLTPPSFLHL